MLRNALFAATVGTLATVGAAKAQESAAAKAIEAAKQFAGTHDHGHGRSWPAGTCSTSSSPARNSNS